MNLVKLFETHKQWFAVQDLLSQLSSKGYESYLAGGCVRDGLMAVQPADFDVATEATPDQIKKMFPRAIEVGRAFGVMMIPFESFQIEVTTFRKDGEYQDGRRPESVTFCKSKEDALRRDFTINALFYDIVNHRVVDYVDGIQDIKNKIIRTVGVPQQRFSEDKLRLMRAARFSGQLNFEIEKQTLSAMHELSGEILQVSQERITAEFKKISQGQVPAKSLAIMQSTKMLEVLWPGFHFFKSDLWSSFLTAVQISAKIKSFEMLVSYFLIYEILHRVKSSEKSEMAPEMHLVVAKDSRRQIDFLVDGFFHFANSESPHFMERSLILLNHELGPLLSELCYNLSLLRLLPRKNIVEVVERFLELSDDKGHLPKPFLTGEDLLKLGFEASSELGEKLKELYFAQLRGEIETKDQALDKARSH